MTNAVLNGLVLVLLVVVLAPRLRGLRRGPLLWTAVVMVVLTAVFDNVMILSSLVDYAPDKILGVLLWRAPIEDFAYSLAAVVLMPACWVTLRARSRRTDPAPATDEADS
ncbi:lycopene cyclase domain-containing protein [Pengzhenrongella frigida]|uniref:Lycopene cyclase domain-containing protein n=1 Tax=Pengzhenrongella frigida TaxID=1259133 RepID=A0A4Q5N093_9MICO|nr:lycopene cyclase domain-containing protein [Cellulomonas sp. HLT2-17]RYV51435.1 lycopene cyclase domain-containing protein [Cellulomonas sp. HLT2-17]